MSSELRNSDWTDLHWAAWCQDLDGVKGILATDLKGIINIQDDQGWTSLHLACCSENSKFWAVHQLAQRNLDSRTSPGSDLTKRPGANSKYTMLAYASSRYARSPMNFEQKTVAFMIALDLLQAGADVAPKAQGFCTPLHCAVNSGWIDHIDALLFFGASLRAGDECSPVYWVSGSSGDYLRREDHERTRDYLQKWLGPDAWNRIRNDGGLTNDRLPEYSWPSQRFRDWYFMDFFPNTSRGCLPGARAAVSLAETSTACSLCKAISIGSLSSPPGYLHAKSLHDLERSSSSRSICSPFFTLLKIRLPLMTESDISQVVLRSGIDVGTTGPMGTTSVLKLQLSSGCFCNAREVIEKRSLDFSSCTGKCGPILMEDLVFDFFTSDCE
jgi:hypothetical protein